MYGLRHGYSMLLSVADSPERLVGEPARDRVARAALMRMVTLAISPKVTPGQRNLSSALPAVYQRYYARCAESLTCECNVMRVSAQQAASASKDVCSVRPDVVGSAQVEQAISRRTAGKTPCKELYTALATIRTGTRCVVIYWERRKLAARQSF